MGLFQETLIKDPNIKNEACLIDVPELEWAYCELIAARAETAAVVETLAMEEATKSEEEEAPSVPPEVMAAQLLEEARQQAEAILAQARGEAESILAELEARRKQTEEELAQAKKEAEAECDRLKKEAYDRGYEEGWNKGHAEGEKAWAERITAAETTLQEAKAEALNLINRADEERIARIRESEQEILKLAVEIAEKIINNELKADPDKWLGMIKVATEKITGAAEVTIRIAQEDEAFLIQNLREVRSLFTESPRLQVVTDPNLKPGDFILQSNMGEVDARLHQQLNKIYQALKEEGS
ncbi:FliH/SctL family protein [Capillibacterium thermochitinicola]|uniref:Flagellar assembly protein FliH/Type III secretion system HrpE domain-containing protein n=1 Tax=Capillibacterium thermochitinicola TaxID=2699427 RepID=A0A8J6I4I9_9FIRM|nr:FliH/SctL family protein [Capillibacterium thermochitinicola]MBA2134062.1 hypothetical protein [Capillibacterium thermochitinicola]